MRSTASTWASSVVAALGLALVPGCEPAQQDVALVVYRLPSAHLGEIHALVLESPELAPAPSYVVERSCGGGSFEEVATLTRDEPLRVARAPRTLTVEDPVPAVLEASAALDDAVRAALDCAEDPACADLAAARLAEARTRPDELGALLEGGATDPRDLEAPSGDDAVDVARVEAVWTEGGGVATFIAPYGAWPPSDELYSWYVIVRLHDASGAPLGEVVVQRHSGARETILENVVEAGVSVLEGADGIGIRVGLPPEGTTFVSVESGVLRTPSDVRVSDLVPDDGRIEIVDRRPRTDVVLADCVYRGVPPGGPAVAFQNAPDGPRRYSDWDATVSAAGDPCDGRTPLECYRERLEEWKRRVCGQTLVDGMPAPTPPDYDMLPSPDREMCRAIHDGWVTFAEPSCDPLRGGAAGKTAASPHGSEPPRGGSINGRTATVSFDTAHLAGDVCSYGTFFHEIQHVLDDALWEGWGLYEDAAARLEIALARVGVVNERLERAVDARDLPAARDASDALTAANEELRLASEANSRMIHQRRFASECSAFHANLLRVLDLTDGAPFETGPDADPEAVQRAVWQKSFVDIFLDEMTEVLEGFEGTFDDAARAAACACVADFRARAQSTPLPIGMDLWQCTTVTTAQGDPSPDARYEALRARLGCP